MPGERNQGRLLLVRGSIRVRLRRRASAPCRLRSFGARHVPDNRRRSSYTRRLALPSQTEAPDQRLQLRRAGRQSLRR